MNNKKLFFDSLSPFWVTISPNGTMKSFSSFFDDILVKEEGLEDYFEFKKIFILDRKNYYKSFENKVIKLLSKKDDVLYRTTFHKMDQEGLLILWPLLNDLKKISDFGVEEEMSHPAAVITDLLISKDMIRVSSSKLRALEVDAVSKEVILSSTPSSLKVISLDGSIIHINTMGLELVEEDQHDDIKGKSIYNFILEEYQDDFKKSCKDSLKGSREALIFEMVTAKGRRKWVEAYIAPYNHAKDDKCLVTIMNDVSDRVAMEQELEKQKKISFHTAKLASLGQLAAGVGHEINNPMAIIKGHSSVLKKIIKVKNKIEIAEVLDSLDKMDAAIDRVSKIVVGLKNFSRDEGFEFTTFNLSDVILESIEMIKDIYEKDSFILNADIKPQLFLWGNRGRIQQVLMNLLSNARDASMESSERLITISAQADQTNISIRFQDKGSGIPDDVIDNIFDPFFTTKEVNKGTGIGLALCYQIMSEHGGNIVVDSTGNEGTTFLVTLPLSECPDNAVEDSDAVLSEEESMASGHILIVDDEEEIRSLLGKYLEGLGYEVTLAENGKVALEMFNENLFDAVITDVKMPIMDGFELVEKISRIKKNKIPVCIIMTGGTDPEKYILNESDKRKKLLDEIIYKPFDFELIEKKLKELI